jgi:4-hydroxy-4-methyl-2-oxoglutarate aldolase
VANGGEIGARRRPRVEGPAKELVDALAQRDTTDLADAMHSSHVMDGGVRPLYPAMQRFAGPAVTVTVPAGSQEVRKQAMDMAQAGDVLVIDARGVTNFSVLGGRLAKRLHEQGLAGVVIDGCIRDMEEIQALGLPVFCRGHSIAAAPKTGPGEINVPVVCGGIVVSPGDVVVGDANGVAVVPREAAAEIVAKVPVR